jgi:hypothetical protein
MEEATDTLHKYICITGYKFIDKETNLPDRSIYFYKYAGMYFCLCNGMGIFIDKQSCYDAIHYLKTNYNVKRIHISTNKKYDVSLYHDECYFNCVACNHLLYFRGRVWDEEPNGPYRCETEGVLMKIDYTYEMTYGPSYKYNIKSRECIKNTKQFNRWLVYSIWRWYCDNCRIRRGTFHNIYFCKYCPPGDDYNLCEKCCNVTNMEKHSQEIGCWHHNTFELRQNKFLK